MYLEIAFASNDEEGAALVKLVQPSKVEIATIHHIKSPGFWGQLIEDIDFVHFAIADMDERRNNAA